jgi:hypothetical protein
MKWLWHLATSSSMMQLSSAIIGKTECLKTSLCPSNYQLSWVAQDSTPSFFNSIALLIVSSTPIRS